MLHHLKITRNKVKTFFFFMFVYLVFLVPFNLLAGIITKNFGWVLIEKIGVINSVLKVSRLFIVSYMTIVFIKKEFFLKKYLKELAVLFITLLISNKLFALFLGLSYKIGFLKVDSSIIMQVPYLVLQVVVYYMIICFLVKHE